MPIHRRIKNVVHNYTDAERKVREATSNDPWGPSSTLMAEIADKTHNVMAFTEIMQMIWRRLNDKSKNWRHVYKALVLLEYLIKTGSDKVAIQCKENFHSIDSLQEFEYFEDGKDHGHNVRAKARFLSSLLKDEDRLNEERTKALLARDRLMHGGLGTSLSSSTFGSTHNTRSAFLPTHSELSYLEKRLSPTSRSSSVPASSELDSVRPQSAGEEQLHLQLAIAISKEEHDREERRRRAEEAKEEAKVQMALEQSRREDQELLEQQRVPVSTSADGVNTFSAGQTQPGEGLFSLVDTSLSAAPAHVPDPWSSPLADSLTTLGATSTSPSVIPIDDPWTNGAVGSPSKPAVSPPISTSAWSLNPGSVPLTPKSAVDLASNGAHSSPNEANGTADNDSNKDGGTPNRRHTPADFLGEHQRLVDLEKLVEKNPASTNPFAVGLRPIGGGPSANPFLANQPAKLSLNQLAPPLAPSSSNLSPSHPPLRGLQTIQSPFNVAPANYFVSMHGNPWSASNPVLPQNQASMNPFY